MYVVCTWYTATVDIFIVLLLHTTYYILYSVLEFFCYMICVVTHLCTYFVYHNSSRYRAVHTGCIQQYRDVVRAGGLVFNSNDDTGFFLQPSALFAMLVAARLSLLCADTEYHIYQNGRGRIRRVAVVCLFRAVS